MNGRDTKEDNRGDQMDQNDGKRDEGTQETQLVGHQVYSERMLEGILKNKGERKKRKQWQIILKSFKY